MRGKLSLHFLRCFRALVFLGLCTVFGCETSDIYQKRNNADRTYKVESKTYREVMQDKTFSKAILRLPQTISKGKITGRDEEGEEYQINLDSAIVNVITTLNRVTYTFLANKGQNSRIENYVLDISDPALPLKNQINI